MRIHTLKDILIVILLAILVTLTCLQDGDILKTKRRVFMLEGGLQYVYGGLCSLLDDSGSTKGGLVPTQGGLDFRAASATLSVAERPKGPITIGITETRGTGVFVSDNVLLTAKHVVDDRTGLSGVKITGPGGVTYTAVEILEDADDDLALVFIQGRCGPWLSLGPWPVLGDDVTCIGAPLNFAPQHIITTWGRVSSENWANKFTYDGFTWPGCSGGPVIINGKIAGVTVSRLRRTASLGFAVPVDRLDPSLMARIR